jgi:serine protease DegQ
MRRRVPSWAVRAALAAALCSLFSWGAAAQDQPQAAAAQEPTATAIAATSAPAPSLLSQASGIFINQAGDVLTARHAVLNCHSLYVVKDSRAAPATVLALGENVDLAVLHTGMQPYLSATFAHTSPSAGSGAAAVFSEDYNVLQRMPDRATALANALTVPGSDGLLMLSGARPGASGSAVLDRGGLVLGVVVERVAAGPGAAAMMLSRSPSAPAPLGATRVKAVPVAEVREFLRGHHIDFTESDEAQLGPTQSTASRAATVSAGVVCG